MSDPVTRDGLLDLAAVDAGLAPGVAAWIGRRSERRDIVTDRVVAAFRATFAPHLAPSDHGPLGIHWCLAPDIVPAEDLGPDGHPRAGLHLPALPYSRRMWAGGELVLHRPLSVGDTVTKVTEIADVALKTGSTGKLAFLTIRHEYRVGAALVLEERQDVVYRDAAGTGSRPSAPPSVAAPAAAALAWTLTTDPTLLFRYSALTFNGHRIHYDQPYATGVEGYDGLVVHGPIQATLLLNLAATAAGSVPNRFSYRGHAPLVCGLGIRVEADEPRDRACALRIVSGTGAVTMTARAFG